MILNNYIIMPRHVATEEQRADVMKKALSGPNFERAVSGFLMPSPTAHVVAANRREPVAVMIQWLSIMTATGSLPFGVASLHTQSMHET